MNSVDIKSENTENPGKPELDIYLVWPTLSAADGRLDTVMQSSLSLPSQTQTEEFYMCLQSNNSATS